MTAPVVDSDTKKIDTFVKVINTFMWNYGNDKPEVYSELLKLFQRHFSSKGFKFTFELSKFPASETVNEPAIEPIPVAPISAVSQEVSGGRKRKEVGSSGKCCCEKFCGLSCENRLFADFCDSETCSVGVCENRVAYRKTGLERRLTPRKGHGLFTGWF